MKPAVTISFLLLFFVVAGFYFYLSPPDSGPREASQFENMKVLPLQPNDKITSIEIENRQTREKISIERRKDGWAITHPVADPADPIMVEGLIAALSVSSHAGRLLPERSWQEYGLEEPDVRVGIQSELNAHRRSLFLGDESPVGNYLYARWESEREYFLIEPQLKAVFDRSLYALRFKKVFHTATAEISKIHFHMSSEDFEIAKYESRWFWMQPIPILGEEADPGLVQQLLLQLSDLYVKEFLDDENQSREALGVSSLGRYIRVWGKAEGPEIVYLGDSLSGRDALYGFREGAKAPLLIAQSNVDSILDTFRAAAQKGP